MELNERETLLLVEQQLKDSIKNQSQIIGDLHEIFDRIDKQAKNSFVVESDLRVHLETYKILKSEIENKVKEFDEENTSFKKQLDDLDKKINEEATERKDFEKEITTTVKVIKAIVGIILTLLAIAGGIAGLLEFLHRK